MICKEVQARTALSRSGLEGTDLALNPYNGCGHGCKYCYAPYVVHREPEEWRGEIQVKKNIPMVLAKELKKIDITKDRNITIGTVTDPYQPCEAEHKLTRYCIEQLHRYKIPVSIVTKSPLITRDKELFKGMDLEVGVSVSTLDEEFRKVLETNTPSTQERLEALASMKEHRRYLFIAPIFPGKTDLEFFFWWASENEIDYIIADDFHFRKGMERDLPSDIAVLRRKDYSSIRKEILALEKQYDVRTYLEF